MILLNFDRYGGYYYVQPLAGDARTSLGRWRRVESRETLVRLLRYIGAVGTYSLRCGIKATDEVRRSAFPAPRLPSRQRSPRVDSQGR